MWDEKICVSPSAHVTRIQFEEMARVSKNNENSVKKTQLFLSPCKNSFLLYHLPPSEVYVSN